MDNLTPLQHRAKILLDRSIPVVLVGEGIKDAFEPGFQNNPITSFDDPRLHDPRYVNCNTGALAQAKLGGFWIFEVDDPAVLEKIKQDTGHGLQEAPTLVVASRENHWHFYFQHTEASMKMGNVPQLYGPFSGRVNNMYVVGPESHRNDLNINYEIVIEKPVAPAPDWFVQWIMDQRKRKSTDSDAPRNETGRIPHGFIHGWMVTQAGKLRSMGADVPTIETTLLALVHANCEPPIDEDKVRQCARSFERYEPQPDSTLPMKLDQKPDNGVVPPAVEQPTLQVVPDPYPEFPTWVMTNTSIYENLVKPVVEHNSRIDYFMWLPATAMLLNYLGTKIQVQNQFGKAPITLSQYMVIIGKRGETNKSSSVDDAMQYFNYMGCLAHNGGGLKTAEGKSVVWSAGSPEGMGIEAQKANCKNIWLFYDELSQLTMKAGIDGSALVSALLTLYESKKFGNTVKKNREAYALEPGSYCASLIACTTDEDFHDLWSKMNGNNTGLNDRVVFVLQPQTLPEYRLKVDVPYLEKSVETRRLIDKAIQQGVFEFRDIDSHGGIIGLLKDRVGTRIIERAKKWALAIAVDLGLDHVDDESLDRGVAIVRYEMAVKKYLKSRTAKTLEGALQNSIVHHLRMNGCELPTTVLKKKCNGYDVGTTKWNQAYYGLYKDGVIAERGKGAHGDPKITRLLSDDGIAEVA